MSQHMYRLLAGLMPKAPPAPPSPPAYSYIGTHSATIAGNVLSKTGIAVVPGLLLIEVAARQPANFQYVSGLVGVDAASLIVQSPAGLRNTCAIFAKEITVAGSVDVSITADALSSAIGSLSFTMLTGLSSITPIDTDNSGSATGATSSALGLDLTADAIGLWVSMHREPEVIGWTNATELHDDSAGTNHRHSSAVYQASSTLTRTATAAWATSDEWSMVAAAWR